MMWNLLFLFLNGISGREQPNIVFIQADDLGWADVNWNNKAINTTPYLESLLKNKNTTLHSNHYATHRCSPTRAALLTGVYPFRYGLGKHALKPVSGNAGVFDTTLKLLPEYLKEAGYSTHLVGKWHLGFQQMGSRPMERGYDSFFGFLQAEMFPFKHRMAEKMILMDGDRLINKTGDYSTYLFSDRAEEILMSDDDGPKFIHLAHSAPHLPHAAPDDLVKLIRDEYESKAVDVFNHEYLVYQAMIRALDLGVNQIHQAALKLKRETIIIFTSDNGAADHGCNLPLRGGKSQLTEGGVRVPTLLTSTKRQLPKQNENLSHVVDWFPTIIELGDATVPDNIDGISFAKSVFSPWSGTGQEPIRNKLIVGVLHQFDPHRRAWGIQFAVIYNGFKFYNQESYNARADMKNRLRTCNDIKIPLYGYTTAFQSDIVYKKRVDYLQGIYDYHLKSTSRHTNTENPTLYDLSNDPAELINYMDQRHANNKHHIYRTIAKEIFMWMKQELESAPLPQTGHNNEEQRNIFLELSEKPWSYLLEYYKICEVERERNLYQNKFTYGIKTNELQNTYPGKCKWVPSYSNVSEAQWIDDIQQLSQFKHESDNGSSKSRLVVRRTETQPVFYEWRRSNNLPVFDQTYIINYS